MVFRIGPSDRYWGNSGILQNGWARYDRRMAPTVKDLISTAVTAAQNQATAQTATRAAVAQIASQRPATGLATANSAGTPEQAQQ